MILVLLPPRGSIPVNLDVKVDIFHRKQRVEHAVYIAHALHIPVTIPTVLKGE
jgi:hypothetical protein